MHILRLPAVIKITGLPKSTIYLYMKRNNFPKPVKLGLRSVGWIMEEVETWLTQLKSIRGGEKYPIFPE